MSRLAILGGSPVREKPLPLYPFYGAEEEEAVLRVVRSNKLCSQAGDEVREFEDEYAAYHGVPHAVAVNSGTSALQVALMSAGIGAGDEVIVPPYTFVATATAVIACCAVPVFADIEKKSLGLDPDEVTKKIGPRTKAMIPVHMNGFPCDMEALLSIAKEHDLVVIEDCSHAHGALYHGKRVGSLGHMGAFSFQHRKNMSLGEGGIVITRHEHFAEPMRAIRSFGNARMTYNYRMSEFHGAIGKIRLKKLDQMNLTRHENAEILTTEFTDLDGLSPLQTREGCRSVYYNYVLLYDEAKMGIDRSRFKDAVNAEGVELISMYSPLHRHPIMKERNAFGHGMPFQFSGASAKKDDPNASYPVTEEICDRRVLEIKVHPPCGREEMLDTVNAIRKVIQAKDQLIAAETEKEV